MKVFCDGVFDLFHSGHYSHFKKIKDKYHNCTLIVGVMNDKDATNYKRQPIHTIDKRMKMVSSCKYVDKVTKDYPIVMNKQFMDNNNIDLIVHAFSDKQDIDKQNIYFEYPKSIGKFETIEYDTSISTTKIIHNINNSTNNTNNKQGWDRIWELKGQTTSNNLFDINGYDDTDFNYEETFKHIISKLGINEGERILEVGCGAGMFTKLFMNDYDYYGIDYSRSLINKNIELNNSIVYNCEAIDTPFKDKYFDYVISVGVFEYFPNKQYMNNVLKEINRVCSKGIYILNIRHKTHSNKLNKHKFDGPTTHTIFQKDDFNNFEIIDSTYEQNSRFSAYKSL